VIESAQALWLALVQGVTEFLPISSAAHLVLVPELLGWPDQGLAFDVAVHVGTLLAVAICLRRDIAGIVTGWLSQWGPAGATPASRLGWLLILATIPAVLVGALLNDVVEQILRNPLVIAAATMVFALFLWWADWRVRGQRQLGELTARDALVIGIAQALALIPGVSRSGITMTAGLALGLGRKGAARFSFLLSVPVILAAGVLKGIELGSSAGPVNWVAFTLSIVVAFASALAVIALFLRFIERTGMLPFVLYRLLLGAFLFAIFW